MRNKELIINILLESFSENKSVNFVVKQDKMKDKRLRILMEYSYFMSEKFGKIYLSEDKLACALLIDPIQKRTTLLSIIWDIKLLFRCIGISNLGKVLKREKSIKRNHPISNFIHLWYIGVKKNVQGKGLGTNLMNKIISDYSKIGKPIYLETSMEMNFPFYEKLGFEKVSELNDFGYDLRMYINKSSEL